jgi:hypothetical protein
MQVDMIYCFSIIRKNNNGCSELGVRPLQMKIIGVLQIQLSVQCSIQPAASISLYSICRQHLKCSTALTIVLNGSRHFFLGLCLRFLQAFKYDVISRESVHCGELTVTIAKLSLIKLYVLFPKCKSSLLTYLACQSKFESNFFWKPFLHAVK